MLQETNSPCSHRDNEETDNKQTNMIIPDSDNYYEGKKTVIWWRVLEIERGRGGQVDKVVCERPVWGGEISLKSA